MPPDFTHETTLTGRVAGLDEVGRGPLAGPVAAAAVILTPDRLDADLLSRINDSKALRPAEREAVARLLRARLGDGVAAAVACASVREIAAINILRASHLAMRRALARLPVRPDHALVDGKIVPANLGIPATAIIGGDGLSLSIAAASILAKVARDRAMARLAARHPAYGWERNAGYGTAEHRAAILAHGVTAHHRIGFRGVSREAGIADS